MDARVERLAEHIGFWSSVDAGGTDALCDAIGCKLGLSFGSRLFDVTVRVEELLAGFDVPGGMEDKWKIMAKADNLKVCATLGRQLENEINQ